MHVALRPVLVLLGCIALLAASRWDKPSGRIYGGHEAPPHGHPYIVSLQQKFFFVRVHVCGGSLITEQWVVTAAHCVVSSVLVEWLFPLDRMVAGAHDVVLFDSYAQVSDIEKKIVHPSFDWRLLHNDIAMIRTTTAFKLTPQVQTIRLPVNYRITAQPMVLAGWGALRTTSFIPDTPRNLHEVMVKYMPFNECFKAVKKVQGEVGLNKSKIAGDMLDEAMHVCSGPEPRGVSGCPGDSGGPVVQYAGAKPRPAAAAPHGSHVDETVFRSVDSTTHPVLIGVASWIVATPCGRTGMPTVYTNVSNYIDFIKESIDT